MGLYKPWVANMDEGWTRWIFDTWEFPYTTLQDAEVRNGNLKKKLRCHRFDEPHFWGKSSMVTGKERSHLSMPAELENTA